MRIVTTSAARRFGGFWHWAQAAGITRESKVSPMLDFSGSIEKGAYA